MKFYVCLLSVLLNLVLVLAAIVLWTTSESVRTKTYSCEQGGYRQDCNPVRP